MTQGKTYPASKRHVAVDTQGLPHAIGVTTANITDRKGALIMITQAKENLSQVDNLLVDEGYSGDKFAEAVNYRSNCRGR